MKRASFLLFAIVGLFSTAAVRGDIVNVAGRGIASTTQPLYGTITIAQLIDGSTANFVHADVAPGSPFSYAVDLSTNYNITGFKIHPRQDGCCADRLTRFRVSVHNDDGSGGVGTEVWGIDLYTDGTDPGSTAGSVVEVSPPTPVTGRHVQILSLADPIPDYALQIAELQILADVPASDVNRSQGTSAIANQPLFGNASAALLVDGSVGTLVHGVETITTPFFYTINMGTKIRLSQIIIWARQDTCCAERLSNYRVSVHEDNAGSIGSAVWQVVVHGDGSNPGSEPGSKDVLTAADNPGGTFEGQWLKIEALDDPLPPYALQIAEVEARGEAIGGPSVLILEQPVSTAAAVGQTAQFSVAASVVAGDASLLGYQWRRNGTPIEGATNAVYTTPPILADDDKAEFTCVLTYPGLADITTDEAVLRVNLAYQATAYSNRPLWANGGWNISMLTDGNRNAALHGDVDIEAGMAYEVDLGTEVAMEEIDIFPRQDGCCPERLANFRVSVHEDNAGAIGDEVWKVDLYTDGTNPGASAGSVVKVTANQDPAGMFTGRWIRILALDDPIPNYHLQMSEIEVYGDFVSAAPILEILTQPVDAPGAPGRTARFTLAARVLNGNPQSIGYQWHRDGAPIPGATTNVYVTPPLVDQDTNADFYCVVSYPGVTPIQSGNAKVFFDYNYSRGQPAFSNRPLWGPGNWSIAMLVDGDRLGVLHGDTQPGAGFAYDVDLGTEVDIERIDIYPRQDGCCPERLANFRVSVHDSTGGVIGDQNWAGDFFTDGSNAGSGPDTLVSIDESQGTGEFAGSWVRILALDDPVPDYFLQVTEIEVYGRSTEAPRPTVTFNRSATDLVLTWTATGFVLQSADSIAGPWTNVDGATSPATIPITTGPGGKFFQLRSQ